MSKENIATIIEWHKKTFPDATLSGQLKKFVEEKEEYENADRSHRLEELADMFIVACGISRFDMWQGAAALSEVQFLFSHHDKRNVLKTIDKKMAINRKRKWSGTNGMYRHCAAGCRHSLASLLGFNKSVEK